MSIKFLLKLLNLILPGVILRMTGLKCYQSVLDAKAANDIFEVIKELKLKTIEDWYYDLIDDTEETMDLMKETITEKKSNA